MWLRKTITPGAAPGGYVWDTPADVVDVPDDLAAELLAIPRGGFEPASPPVAADGTASADASAADADASVADSEVAEAPKRRTRKPADQAVADPQTPVAE
jgi:hypothetical protein